ncbi:MAG: DUF1292 domain-containing protein [Solobacterium sp.]|jgi:uncharacterized protein YrzB (UPF0473 family)|nr:DUF1292 domain-containing protein [Solobacterium sp.]MCH4204999.1 DUF1292 domain-containing protein [Solobacterium sp.]MCH4226508.1 DUF1292 domain-containing protein [Solobacterium sp.]MCH4281792.1 DUF1292 domain-containing protein [Solobacterium sp.]
MEENSRMMITDESGQEREVEIILTFDDEKGQSFVLFQDPQDAEGTVFAYRYDEDGNMNEVTDETEWNMCQEVLGAFMDEDNDDE